jgi:hypothetical protein
MHWVGVTQKLKKSLQRGKTYNTSSMILVLLIFDYTVVTENYIDSPKLHVWTTAVSLKLNISNRICPLQELINVENQLENGYVCILDSRTVESTKTKIKQTRKS